jgi:Flp pilus assembly protein TadB
MGPRSRGLRGRSKQPEPTTAATPRPVQGRASVASSQIPSRRDRSEPLLITEAEPSQADQHAARKKRYAITMAVRGVSLVVAALTAQYSLWLMAVFAVLGTVLPWIAVVMANDRPPKKHLDVNRYRPPAPDRILESGSSKVRVIDM